MSEPRKRKKQVFATKDCVRCGVEYMPTNGKQKYCPRCRIIVGKLTVIAMKERNSVRISEYNRANRWQVEDVSWR